MTKPTPVDLIIPERLLARLSEHQEVLGGVLNAVAKWMPYLRENKLTLFPGFPDHGPQHLNDVLATADLFITEPAAAKLSSHDVAALVLAVMLHDIAMHLSVAGLKLLVGGRSHVLPRRARPYFPQDPVWKDLWDEHLSHVRRWSRSRLQDVVGRDTYPGDPPEESDWTRAHYLIGGDFVRRHHPRMAWEFAWIGLPGAEHFVQALSEVDEHVRLVASLTARSHGVSLRVGSSWFDEDRHRRRYRDMHPTYLMAVLRLADYLQIHRARADPSIPPLRSISSSASKKEWRKHGATFFEMQVRADAEALEVEVEPDNAHTFLAFKKLFDDIQHEMDATWAVLGEVYGRFDEMPRTLNFRRLRSNLEDKNRFAASVDYVPAPFCLAPSPRLLPHLVGPLYNHNPSFGYRELLQNAVDAVRERAVLQPDGEYGVEISLETRQEPARLVVADQGIGMTPETIQSYYLNAGSSICTSTEWQAQFHGSGVLRVGRFGIGALASFLLADNLKITTRHLAAAEALQFSCRLEGGNIEVRRVEGFDIGTEVVLEPLTSDTVAVLRSAIGSWYSSEQPIVRVVVDGVEMTESREHRGRLQSIESCLGLDISVVLDERQGFIEKGNDAATYVNGFRIGEPVDPDGSSYGGIESLPGIYGDVHIQDPNHTAPINLTRTKLEYDFLEDEDAMRSLFELLRELWDGGPGVDEWLVRADAHDSYAAARWKHGLNLNWFAYHKGALFPKTKELLCRLVDGKVYQVELRRGGGGYSPSEWLPHLDAPVLVKSWNPGVYTNFSLSHHIEKERLDLKGVYAPYPPPSLIGELNLHLSPTEIDGRLVKRRGDPEYSSPPEQLWHRDIAGWSMNLYRVDRVPETPFAKWWLDTFPNGLPLAD